MKNLTNVNNLSVHHVFKSVNCISDRINLFEGVTEFSKYARNLLSLDFIGESTKDATKEVIHEI